MAAVRVIDRMHDLDRALTGRGYIGYADQLCLRELSLDLLRGLVASVRTWTFHFLS